MALDPAQLDFAAIAAQAPVAWGVVDLDGRLIAANQAYAELFGRPVDEITSTEVIGLVHPDYHDQTAELFVQVASGELDRAETEKRYLRADGTEFTGRLAMSAIRDPDGKAIGMIGIITDVTEVHSLIERVARSEDRLAKMLTNISDTVTLVADDGSITATTGMHTEILGYPEGFWAGRSVFEVVHPDEAERATTMAEEVLRGPGSEHRDEFRVRHHDGHWEHAEITAVNLLDDPAVRAVVLTTRNISDRKASERELLEMRDQALRLAEQRAGFVANVSHELRTPLHAVLGLSELLAGSELTAEQSAQVEGIRSEALHLRDTVDDLLDYVRIEAAGLALEPGPVDLRDVVDRIVSRARSAARVRTVEVVGEVDDTIPPLVWLDGHRVEQILTNLVGNAVKFTDEGSVSVEVTLLDGDRLCFAVADTGVGIAGEHLARIFEPFQQVPGTSPTRGGSGLGLALVDGLAQLMDGSVTVDSHLGAGTTVRVEVPLARLPATTPEGERSGGPTRSDPTPGAEILVVEDTPVNQMLISAQLERLGHRSTIVGTAAEALALLGADHTFAAVLMDWQLPDIDGLEATRRIRRMEADRPGRAPVPVIAVTASAMPEDRAACRDAGMDDFLAKPVSLADLDVLIRRWTNGTSAPAPASPRPDERLDDLVDDLGDRDIVVALVGQYLDELDGRADAVAAALDADDVAALRRIGHTLRSTSGMLGVVELEHACSDLEQADDPTDPPLVERVNAAMATARVQLRAWLDRPGGQP